MERRNYIFTTLKDVFKKFGYSEIQTPSFENLNTLTGKYGDEGDKLIFKILNSGDYLKKVPEPLLSEKDSTSMIPHISEQRPRYDLTVPCARRGDMHEHDSGVRLKRFQIRAVWRAARARRGR